VLAGSVLFVLGFSAVFVTSGALFGSLGSVLAGHQDVVDVVLGLLTILLGPGVPRARARACSGRCACTGCPRPGSPARRCSACCSASAGRPASGPTLAAVQTLAYREASAGRGALLTAAYCAGLGIPFVLTGLAFSRALGAFAVVKRHYAVVMRVGGGCSSSSGLLLVSGLWGRSSPTCAAGCPASRRRSE
jgi:cytochrome c-type biogenesis protein